MTKICTTPVLTFCGEILQRPGQVAERGDLRRGALGVRGRGREEKDSDAVREIGALT